VATFHALQRIIAKKKAGEKVKVAVKRGGEVVEAELELAKAPVAPPPSENGDGEGKEGPSEPKVPAPAGPGPFFGVEVEAGDGPGVKITAVKEGSPAAKAGLVVGDLLLKCNDRDIATPADAAEFLRSLKAGDKLTVKARRGDTEFSGEAALESKP
jgi:S1-C subfamily serine protease